MSLVESFHKIKTDRLADLVFNSEVIIQKKLFSKKTIDNFWTFVEKNSEQLADLDFKQFNGGVFLYILTYLEEISKINLAENELKNEADILCKNRQASIFLLTETTKKKYSQVLNLENFDVVKIQKYNTEVYDDNDLETAKACIEAIKLLKKHIDSIDGPNEFILFSLG